MQLTPAQAGKQVGRSKQGIMKAIKDGRLSATKTPSGGYLIDPSELFRVYKPANQVDDNQFPKVVDSSNNQISGLLVEVATLRERISGRDAEIRRYSEQIEDLRAALAHERTIIRALTDERAKDGLKTAPEAQGRAFTVFGWLRGRKS